MHACAAYARLFGASQLAAGGCVYQGVVIVTLSAILQTFSSGDICYDSEELISGQQVSDHDTGCARLTATTAGQQMLYLLICQQLLYKQENSRESSLFLFKVLL